MTFKLDYASIMGDVSRKFKMTSGSMSRDAIADSTVSTGMLAVDLILGGGIVGGRWYSAVGGEGAGKTTLKTHVEIAAADANIPILLDADYEGCFVESTLLEVNGKPVVFGDLLKEYGVTIKDGAMLTIDVKSEAALLVDSYKERNVLAQFKYGGYRRTTKVRLENGLTFEGAAHPIMARILTTAASPDAITWFSWVMLEMLRPGTHVLVKVGTLLPDGSRVQPVDTEYGCAVAGVRSFQGSEYVAVKVLSVEKHLQQHVWDVTLKSNAIPLAGAIITNGILTHNSSDPKYCEGMIEFWGGAAKTVEDVFGTVDDTGRIIVPPKVEYMTLDTAEDFFNGAASLMRRLPDKVYVEGRWWYAWDDTKVARQQAKGQHSAKMFSKYKRLMIEAEDGKPQGIFFIDSYPMMFPQNLDEDDAGSGMAAVARAMSANVPKVFSKLRKKNFSIVGVNQLRQKPAVMYGCLHYDNMIHFVDGRVLPIGKVVNEKITGKVWSYNEETKDFEPKSITGWHNNGLVADNGWLVVKTQGVDTPNGCTSVMVTPNHKIYTNKGWVEAGKLIVGKHKVLSKYKSVMHGTVAEFLAGSFSADCSFYTDKRSINAKFGLYNHQQPEYQKWKQEKLAPFIQFLDYRRNELRSPCSVEWGMVKEQIGNRNPLPISHHMSLLSLAVIYMDDGTLQQEKAAVISYKRFRYDTTTQAGIVKMWASLGFQTKFWSEGKLAMTVEESRKFFKAIAKYVPECMQYKLPEEFRGRYKEFKLKGKTTVEPIFADIVSVEPGGARHHTKNRTIAYKSKYDITVEGTECYLAGGQHNGILVHNSPFYEPGGDTLKYASSCRIWMTPRSVPHGKGQIEEEPSVMHESGNDTYRYIHLKTVKNKTFTPYLETWMRIWVDDSTGFAHGFDPVWDTYQFLLETGQLGAGSTMKKGLTLPTLLPELKKPIKWIDFKGLILLQGKELKALCAALGIKTNPKIREKCRKQIIDRTAFRMYFDRIAAIKGGKSEEDDGEE